LRKKRLGLRLDMLLGAEVVFPHHGEVVLMRQGAFVAPFSPHKDYFTKLTMRGTTMGFDDWESVLQTEVPAELPPLYRQAIVKFRYWLRQTGNMVTTLRA